ncbi:MAG: cation:proton antiporter [Terrimicrobiaceae bacterium]
MNTDLFYALGVIVIAAAAFAILARLIRLPSIVAFLFAGLLIGPLTGWVESTHAIELISELGIILLLFIVGLELSFDKIRDVGRVAVVAGIGQVVFTAAGGYLLCWVLGFTVMDALFLAVALTFSSTVVVVKVLSDKDELDSLYGRIAVGIFLVQDLVVIVVLTVLSGLRGGEGYDGAAVAMGLAKAFGGMLLLLGGVLVASKYLLPRAFEWASRSPAMVFIWSLFWCFAVVAVAEHLELSIELGAFFAGLSLAQLPYNKDLQHRIKPLMNFFVAVFFVSLGLKMMPGDFVSQWIPVVTLSLFVLLGNPVIFMAIIARFGYGEKTSFLTSVTVAQISEFSFIFVALGASAGLVGPSVITITGLVGIITIAGSAYLILYNKPLYEMAKTSGILKIFRASQKEEDEGNAGLENHIIVVGMNTLGRKLATTLHEQGELVVAVDTDPRKLRRLACKTHLGNVEFRDVLEELGLPRAKLLVSALQIEEANDLLAYRCQVRGIPSAILAIDLSVVDNLLELGVAYLMLPKVDGVKLQNKLLLEKGIISE